MTDVRPDMPGWLKRITDDAAIVALSNAVESGGAVGAQGAFGSSPTLTAVGVHQRTQRPVVIVVAHLDQSDEILEELNDLGVDAARFPAVEFVSGESNLSLDLVAERLLLLRRLRDGDQPAVIVAPIQALMQAAPVSRRLDEMLRVLRPGDRLDPTEFAAWLTESGYDRVETIETAGEFAVRGGIVDVYPPGGFACRIDLFGDEIEQLNEIALETMGSDRRLEHVEIIGASIEQLQRDDETAPMPSMLDPNTAAVLVELVELTEQGRSYFDRAHDSRGIVGPPAVFKSIQERCQAVVELNQYSTGGEGTQVDVPVAPLPNFSETVSEAVEELAEIAQRADVRIFCQNQGEADRMAELLVEFAPDAAICVIQQYLHRGFIWGGTENESRSLAAVPYHELLHRYHTRRRIRRVGAGRSLDAFLDLQPGDFVVHRDHGIARFVGLRMMKTDLPGKKAANEEYLTLEFAKGAKLHIPASKIDLIQKYIGAYRGSPELSTLGGKKWKTQKEKVSEAVKDLAGEMLRLQAAREALPGVRYPDDTKWQREFEAEFPYDETEDQLAAIAACKRDLNGPRPMDRLICGDVGFGKTEVAIRAAFKVAEFGKQVAVLAPTTVLVEQHERTFHDRFAAYPFTVESISRFKTKKQQSEVLERVRKGQVDILIGTHRLLSNDVRFSDLGLVIVDEEQRFGVEHKQRLLEYRASVDVLTLSATPIPRTLHMAMLGLRDISSLSTAPLDRRAIVTEVIPWNKRRIKQAIERELAREGQVFFVHNRVHNIQEMADEVRKLAPDACIVIGHGQMPPRELEKVMLQFTRGEADILVSTTIIESGIDIPTANTMIIHDANMFGLSELHQLRGRVGRHKHRAYCYLTLPKDAVVTEKAMKRMRALEDFSMLGAGFKIAMRDLEIRGAGNLLGPEQSGHIATVGYEMYCQLLEQAVDDLKNRKKVTTIDTVVDIGVAGSIPEGYIPSVTRRLDAYRRVSQAHDFIALEQIEHDLRSAYGDPPKATRILIEVAELRIAATQLGVQSVQVHDKDVIFKTSRPEKLEEHLGDAKGTLRLVGQPDASDAASVYYRPPSGYLEPRTLLTVLRKRLRIEDRIEATVAS